MLDFCSRLLAGLLSIPAHASMSMKQRGTEKLDFVASMLSARSSSETLVDGSSDGQTVYDGKSFTRPEL